MTGKTGNNETTPPSKSGAKSAPSATEPDKLKTIWTAMSQLSGPLWTARWDKPAFAAVMGPKLTAYSLGVIKLAAANLLTDWKHEHPPSPNAILEELRAIQRAAPEPRTESHPVAPMTAENLEELNAVKKSIGGKVSTLEEINAKWAND